MAGRDVCVCIWWSGEGAGALFTDMCVYMCVLHFYQSVSLSHHLSFNSASVDFIGWWRRVGVGKLRERWKRRGRECKGVCKIL